MRNDFTAVVFAAAVAVPVPVAVATSLPSDEGADLSAAEQALAANPDSLALGNEDPLAVIRAKQYDRCLAFFAKLVADHPDAPNARLNYGFASVDKIPAAGAITQVILANNALTEFTRALQLQPSWLAYYTRGNSYLFWPLIFGRAPLGVADLERALEIQRHDIVRSYHVRAFVALGDGYWKLDRVERAREVWAEGARLFPDNVPLRKRLSSSGDVLKAIIDEAFDPSRRVDTDLHDLWVQP